VGGATAAVVDICTKLVGCVSSPPHPPSVNTAAAAIIKVVLFIYATFIFSLYFTIAKWVTNVNRFLDFESFSDMFKCFKIASSII